MMRKIGFRVLAPLVMFGALWGCGEVRTQTTDVRDSGVVRDASQTGLDASDANLQAVPDAAPMITACQDYCTNALASCTGTNQLYSGMDECLTACSGLPVGVSGDTNVNSVYCRSYHATIAAGKGLDTTHCPHASISGDNVCGSLCEAYCSQMAANCGETNSGYASQTACMAACEPMPVGNYNDVSGDSVQCRTYHAGFPAISDQALHCTHASVNGGGQCVPN